MSLTRGSRNLAILGVGAILIASLTTVVSLTIYRTTGDIYLDRSRPGFLPDKDEATAETAASTNFVYSDSGDLDGAELDTYLKELKAIEKRLQDLPDAFSETPLSDESLGIKKAEPATNL